MTVDEQIKNAGLTIPSESEQKRLRGDFFNGKKPVLELEQILWNALKDATSGATFSNKELRLFTSGISIQAIFAERLKSKKGLIQNQAFDVNKKRNSMEFREREKTWKDDLIEVPIWVWVGLFFVTFIGFIVLTFDPEKARYESERERDLTVYRNKNQIEALDRKKAEAIVNGNDAAFEFYDKEQKRLERENLKNRR